MPKVKQISTKLQEYLELLFKELDKNLVNELEPKIMLGNSEEIQKKYQAEMPNDSEMPKVFSRDRKILIISRVNSPPLGAHEKSKKELQYPAACGGAVYFVQI